MKRVAQSVAACALAAWLLALLGSAVPRVVYAVDRSLPTAPEMMAPLTEQEALAAAFARPERQQQWAAEAQRAQAGLDRARTWSNPTLSFSRERIDDALGVPTERSLVLSKDFDLSGRRALDIDAARASRDAASLGVASSQADARAEVRRRFQDAVLGAARLEAQVAQQRDFAHLAAAAVARSTAGDLSALEARRIELRLAEAEVETARRLGEHDRARAALALMIGEALARHPLAQAPLPTAMLDAEQTKSDTTGSRVTQYAEARRDAAEAQARAARRFSMPLSVGVGMKRTDVAGVRDDAAILELSVPLPLFDRRRSDAEAAAAERDIVDAEATLIERETLAAYATAR